MKSGLRTLFALIVFSIITGLAGHVPLAAQLFTEAPEQVRQQSAGYQPYQVFVVNEGSWGNNNATLTVFKPETGEVEQQVFHTYTQRLLGDVANDAQWINEMLYVVVNNSHKIEVIDPVTFESAMTIFIDDEAHGGSPRHILQVSGEKAYVSNLYGDNLSVIDLALGEEIAVIDLGAGSGPEGMVKSGNHVFVALSGMGTGNEVAVVDITGDEVVKRIPVGDNPGQLAVGPAGRIWSVAVGNYGVGPDGSWDPETYETFGELVVIDPDELEVAGRMETGGHPGKLIFLDAQTALLQRDGIRSVDLEQMRLHDEPWLERQMHSFSVDVQSQDPLVYVTIAPDFASAGKVVRYDLSAAAVDSFQAGIGPGPVAFHYHVPTDAGYVAERPSGIQLDQNYPNPFNPATRIRFSLEKGAAVTLEVFDLQGRRVETLASGYHGAGSHTVTVDASGWSSGVYLYRLTSGSHAILNRKMLLVK
ncbi:T9SS type A sorting domain-containing protein [Balneolales bacterium ANBcel1]|nr:T9SS type A sorting domain-containing protein [Balneolales bacterium ANBcel1]